MLPLWIYSRISLRWHIWLCISALVAQISVTDAHGRLLEPPSRASMWRMGFQNPQDYNDNALFCGGAAVSKMQRELVQELNWSNPNLNVSLYPMIKKDRDRLGLGLGQFTYHINSLLTACAGLKHIGETMREMID